MSKKITALFLVAAMTVCMAMPVFAGVTDWNTPTTSNDESTHTSVCEVTADINYAYYVSMPATLALEPSTGANEFKAEYQVKAKSMGNLTDTKNIKIAPESWASETKTSSVTLTEVTDSFKTVSATISQPKVLFGKNNTATIQKVGTDKFYTIDGTVTATITDQGSYAGNFNFVYGLEAVTP